MNEGIFHEVLILLAVAVLVVALFRRLNLPPILGYLFVGVLVGHPGIGWLSMSADTQILAEFGVVFLMFVIGLEFSLSKLITMRSMVISLGGAQVFVSTLTAGALAWALGMTPQGAFVVGGIIAMSSTAIVIKQLTDQGELNAPHGRLAVGVLLFQDLAVIAFLVTIPALAGIAGGTVIGSVAWALVKGALVVAVLWGAGHWLLRPLFREIAARHSSELFILTVLLVTLTAAWATHQAGLSPVLGAFLAGMIISETEFRHQVEADIRPFQDVLLGLFFITIGMRLDLAVLPAIWLWVLLLTAAIVVFKAALVMVIGRRVGIEPGVALRTGISLAQGGEFGFVLLSVALGYGLLEGKANQIVLAAVLLSMALSPLLIRYNGALARYFTDFSYQKNHRSLPEAAPAGAPPINQHVIICGYGRVGQNIARFLERSGMDFVALDLDPLRVREAQEAGDPVRYGDSTRHEILQAAGLSGANALVISYSDLPASFKILEHTRRLRPDLPVLVRARDDSDLERLLSAGATEVVPETLEASLMLASQLLLILGISVNEVNDQVRDVRGDRYRLLRGIFYGEEHFSLDQRESQRERLHTVALPEGAYAIGRTLEQLSLDKFGVVVTVVRRSGIRGPEPEPYTELREDDVLVLYGTPHGLEAAEALLLRGQDEGVHWKPFRNYR